MNELRRYTQIFSNFIQCATIHFDICTIFLHFIEKIVTLHKIH